MISRAPLVRPDRRAFTLVELLVAMTVLVVMIALFAQAVGGITNAWTAAQRQMDNYTKARALLSGLQADMDGIVARPDLVAFPESGTTAPTKFGFYTLRRGVDLDEEADDERALSYVTYSLDAGNEDYPDRLLRSDTSFATTQKITFGEPAEPPAAGTVGIVPIPNPNTAPNPTVNVAVSDGVLDFQWAFLSPDGRFSNKYYSTANDGTKRAAIGVGVAMLVMDEKSASSLKSAEAFADFVLDVRGLEVAPAADGTWNPKLKWEDELGLRAGASGALVSAMPQKRLLGGIRAFQRMYFFPN